VIKDLITGGVRAEKGPMKIVRASSAKDGQEREGSSVSVYQQFVLPLKRVRKKCGFEEVFAIVTDMGKYRVNEQLQQDGQWKMQNRKEACTECTDCKKYTGPNKPKGKCTCGHTHEVIATYKGILRQN